MIEEVEETVRRLTGTDKEILAGIIKLYYERDCPEKMIPEMVQLCYLMLEDLEEE